MTAIDKVADIVFDFDLPRLLLTGRAERRGEEPAVDAAAAVIGEAEQGLLPKSLVRDGQRRRRFMRQISLRHSGLFSDAAPGSLALF